jgi:cyclophilin family peptidyl-prolyl cis-trans isomerase/HEAT repeat protein
VLKTTRLFLAVTALPLLSGACASAPVRPAAPGISDEQKTAWILQLEDQRILSVPAPPAPPVTTSRKAPKTPPPAPVVMPDLTRLVGDPVARIRRRAALAIGRTGLAEGVAPLQTALSDSDPEVREMAAFALGLLLDKAGVAPLTKALQDPDARVRGRAAEALGLIAENPPAPLLPRVTRAEQEAAAAAIAAMLTPLIQKGTIAQIAPDDERWPQAPDIEAVRLGLFAFVRLKTYDQLASAVLDSTGRPVSSWWPVAFALQRIGDPRAAAPLRQLLQTAGRYTRAFAARGLGELKDPASTQPLLILLQQSRGDVAVTVAVLRALGQIGAPEARAPLAALLTADQIAPNVRLEAVAACGALKATEALPTIQDLLTDDWPTLRAAALRAAAAVDPEAFVLLLSGLEPDRHWTVRAALADVLATVRGDTATDQLRAMLDDPDKRVVPAVIDGLTKLKVSGRDEILLGQIKNADYGIRAAAARGIADVKSANGPEALREAYRTGLADSTSDARAEALSALSTYGAAEAVDTLKAALTDKDWAVRRQAAALLARLDPSIDSAHAIRPVPAPPIVAYDSPSLSNPQYSPHAFIETAKGTIEIELAVLDAPQTTANFVALAGKGFFNGLQIHRVVPNFVVQDGDPRGDGSGGPGYTIRDELNERPYLRGTVGMALSGPDTGGSQFFIAHSPQPHLDAKYTVFGRVVNGMDVVDRIQQQDVIQRVRVWDGKNWMGSR